MSGKTSRAALALTAAEEEMLGDLARSRTAPVREAERAKILLAYVENRSITEVMRQVGVGRSTVYKCIDKALADGVAAGLKDAYHRPHEPEIGEEAKAWVVSLACTKPKDHGRAAEVWSISALADGVGGICLEPCRGGRPSAFGASGQEYRLADSQRAADQAAQDPLLPGAA